MMKARPLFAGMICRNSTSASNPPAEAPIPTTQGDDSRLALSSRARCAAVRGAGFDALRRLTPIWLVQSPQSASLRHLIQSRAFCQSRAYCRPLCIKRRAARRRQAAVGGDATEHKTSINDPLIAVPSGRSLEDFNHSNAPAALNQLVRRVPVGAQLPTRAQLGEYVIEQRQIQLSGLLGGFRTQRRRCQRQAISVEEKNRFRHVYLSSSEESLWKGCLPGIVAVFP